MDDSSLPKVIAEADDGIGWVTFNNPARRNAMSLEMWQLTDAALERFENDPDVRVVVLRGAGDKAFMSGADISQFEDQRKNAEQQEMYAKTSESAKARLAAFGKPLVAMIRGFCIGGGLGVAISADIRIASDDSRFGIPAAKLGLAYGFDSLRKLTGLVGPALAKEILFTGRRLDAEEALRIGLVNRVVPAEQLEATVVELAEEIAGNAPLTIRSTKITVDNVMRDPELREMDKVEASFRDCFDSDDYAEGRRAFMEKRKPNFTGA
ncbi:enoyl-CoA hydratase [Roseitranquillus sediminis]|uniref:enoyl-CoA hydratase n=1 Tax=Roseitranquillus sediminis TaxID=2809051 RepID=UPI001D0CAF27|nr:enoyl-CoA hydratase [Roseitranquillus sediminis]MBM9595483.1 enoyl-CoA hydratase/isomerase family protein [Roseitranquillus sediminis]